MHHATGFGLLVRSGLALKYGPFKALYGTVRDIITASHVVFQPCESLTDVLCIHLHAQARCLQLALAILSHHHKVPRRPVLCSLPCIGSHQAPLSNPSVLQGQLLILLGLQLMIASRARTSVFCFLLEGPELSVSLNSSANHRWLGSFWRLRFLGGLGVFLGVCFATLLTLCLAAWTLAWSTQSAVCKASIEAPAVHHQNHQHSATFLSLLILSADQCLGLFEQGCSLMYVMALLAPQLGIRLAHPVHSLQMTRPSEIAQETAE